MGLVSNRACRPRPGHRHPETYRVERQNSRLGDRCRRRSGAESANGDPCRGRLIIESFQDSENGTPEPVRSSYGVPQMHRAIVSWFLKLQSRLGVRRQWVDVFGEEITFGWSCGNETEAEAILASAVSKTCILMPDRRSPVTSLSNCLLLSSKSRSVKMLQSLAFKFRGNDAV